MSMGEEREEVTDNRCKKKETKQKEDSTKIMTGFTLASVHGIVICLLLLISFCFAWFTEVVDGPGFTITAATYGIKADVSGNGAVTSADNSSIEVENGRTYEICLTATGNASTGFCIVSAGDVSYYTDPILQGKSMSFRITFPGSGTRIVELVPYWGEYRDEISAGDNISEEDDISEGDSISGDHEIER